MHDLKRIYICPIHGEVDADFFEIIDCERDDVETAAFCSVDGCSHTVTPKVGEGGIACYRQMTPGEIEWEYMTDEAFEDLYGY